MKRLITVVAILVFTAAGGSLAWAQNPDPLHIGTNNAPAALEGGYQTDKGQFQFLMIAAPQDCIDGTADCPDTVGHLWFYTAACNRVDNKEAPLTKNDVSVFELHSPLVTSNRVGNVLVAATGPGGPFDQPISAENAIIGQTWFIDANRGIGRIEDMARVEGDNGNGWSPYRPAHVLLFAPPDDGVILFDTLIFRCPQGTAVQKANGLGGTVVGTPLTLGGDMLDLAAQDHGAAPGSALDAASTDATDDTICDDCNTNGVFAKALQIFVFDLDEGFLTSVDNVTCRCLGASIGGGSFANEVRLKDITVLAGLTSTYWEIFTAGGAANPAGSGNDDTLFTAALNVQVKSTVNVNFYTRLHSARDRDNIDR